MSYTPDFAPDAESQWQALGWEDQELTLDVLDELCAAPPSLVELVTERTYERDGTRHLLHPRRDR